MADFRFNIEADYGPGDGSVDVDFFDVGERNVFLMVTDKSRFDGKPIEAVVCLSPEVARQVGIALLEAAAEAAYAEVEEGEE